jgi:hypothetical protein
MRCGEPGKFDSNLSAPPRQGLTLRSSTLRAAADKPTVNQIAGR